jgi:peptidoglycan-associated lipoprotein
LPDTAIEEGEFILRRQIRIAFPVLLVALVVAGCKKNSPPPVTATAPAAIAPTAQITASPNVVTAGNQVVLSWSTTNAANVTIDGLGVVSSSGSRTVTPPASMNYHLVAQGSGGTADATARVTVNAVLAAASPAQGMSAEEEFRANVKDVFFDYDKSEIRSDAESVISRDAAYLSNHPTTKVVIGGYCDERGSDEYNLALGENRAETTKKNLINAGVSPNRIRVLSYGKEKPFCTASTETCWQSNRRAGFSLDNN